MQNQLEPRQLEQRSASASPGNKPGLASRSPVSVPHTGQATGLLPAAPSQSQSQSHSRSQFRWQRRLPIGAEVVPGGVHFRVWAPQRMQVTLVTDQSTQLLEAEGNGYHAGLLPGAGPGLRYRFRLAGDDPAYPDPASRWQPDGPHGPSQVVDASSWSWGHARPDTPRGGRIVYEMHIGTFTPEGNWQAAIAALPDLAGLGVNTLELMPVNECPGRFNWGYDGVDLFAPMHAYGTPEDMRAFVDAAHGLGLAVILDVVYNHLGPDGNYLASFAREYFTARHKVDWGEAINFDGPGSGPVREFFLANAAYWMDEFRLDGLRLDATQCLYDSSPRHIIAELVQAARAAAHDAMRTPAWIVAENEPQCADLALPAEQGGAGVDALWNDDFHHAARVALTGHNEAYLGDYAGTPQEFIAAARHGFLFQGQYYMWQGKRRGRPASALPARAFVNCLENHDQVANSGLGRRLAQVAAPGDLRALTALLLLAPGTPMLFQGQEFGSCAPFVFFADHQGELACQTHAGRRTFVAQFPALATAEVQAAVPDPAAPQTFAACKLRPAERSSHAHWLALHRELIALRVHDPAFAAQRADCVQGAVLGPQCFLLRWDVPGTETRLLIVNLGLDLVPARMPEPLLAAPADRVWRMLWSSDAVRYGGEGAPDCVIGDGAGLRLRGRCAVVLGLR